MSMTNHYQKIIAWSEEDQCYVGTCPSLMLGGCHGDNEIAPFSDDEWIDKDESLEFSDQELEMANVSFSQNEQQICESQGLTSLKEKLNDIKPKLSVI